MTTPRKKAAPQKRSVPVAVAQLAATAARRLELEKRLHVIAGKPEHADEFEQLRLELVAL